MSIFNGLEAFSEITPIEKGWSEDKKYRVTAADGTRYLLRISDIAEYDRKKAEFDMMTRVYSHGVPTPLPIEFGLCDEGKSCYSLFGWLEGEDADTALLNMTDTEQYVLGLKTGEILRIIHNVPIPDDAESWNVRFKRKVQQWIDAYSQKPQIHSEIGAMLIAYLEKHSSILDFRPLTFIHGDFNTENIIVMPNDKVGVIDFSTYNSSYGDPWWDVNNMAWMPTMQPYFYSGQIRGLFDGEPPKVFWDVLLYYLAYDALAAMTDPYGLNGIEDGAPIVNNILEWTDSFRASIPTWYLKDIHLQYTDGVPYRLKSPFDFSFLTKYGTVFKVLDSQDSGNICFGVQNGGERYFIKFAGAPTVRAVVSAEEAITNLKRTVPVYEDLAHENLVEYVASEDIGGGFAMIFKWVDADCMCAMYPRSREKFMQMPLDTKYQVFNEILDFHAHVAKTGYVAIDFYDGSIMYDFGNRKTVICDIDFYAKVPYINEMGRLWGSSRFMSPEEFSLGAEIDEVTNVYTMGATAFALFGDSRDRCIDKWCAAPELFEIASRAVSDERSARQQSITQLIVEWRSAKP